LSRPAAEVSRVANSEEIATAAALIGLQAIEYRKLYPLTDDPMDVMRHVH